jgi:hypothetical protein
MRRRALAATPWRARSSRNSVCELTLPIERVLAGCAQATDPLLPRPGRRRAWIQPNAAPYASARRVLRLRPAGEPARWRSRRSSPWPTPAPGRGGGARQGNQLAAAPCRAGRLRPAGEQARRCPLSRHSPWLVVGACARWGSTRAATPATGRIRRAVLPRELPAAPLPVLAPPGGILGCACLPAGRARTTRWEMSGCPAVWEVELWIR